MIDNGSSERHIVDNLKAVLNYNDFFNSKKMVTETTKKDITEFLNSKIKSVELDPEKKWITTWNHYMNHLKFFFRWWHNQNPESPIITPMSEWITPELIRLKMKRTKRVSPYSQTEIWEKDEYLSIIKYEPYKRNKAALALMWDLNARNHEITLG